MARQWLKAQVLQPTDTRGTRLSVVWLGLERGKRKVLAWDYRKGGMHAMAEAAAGQAVHWEFEDGSRCYYWVEVADTTAG